MMFSGDWNSGRSVYRQRECEVAGCMMYLVTAEVGQPQQLCFEVHASSQPMLTPREWLAEAERSIAVAVGALDLSLASAVEQSREQLFGDGVLVALDVVPNSFSS